MGTWEHGRLHMVPGMWFGQHEAEWGVMVAAEWRAQVGPTRVRIPDVTVVLAGPQSPVLQKAPLLIIETSPPMTRTPPRSARLRTTCRWASRPSGLSIPRHARASMPTGPRPLVSKFQAPQFTSSFTLSSMPSRPANPVFRPNQDGPSARTPQQALSCDLANRAQRRGLYPLYHYLGRLPKPIHRVWHKRDPNLQKVFQIALPNAS